MGSGCDSAKLCLWGEPQLSALGIPPTSLMQWKSLSAVAVFSELYFLKETIECHSGIFKNSSTARGAEAPIDKQILS